MSLALQSSPILTRLLILSQELMNFEQKSAEEQRLLGKTQSKFAEQEVSHLCAPTMCSISEN